jgi:Family of unknown function (DUF6545)
MIVDGLEIGVLVAFWTLTIWRFATPQSPRGRAVRLVILLVTVSFTLNRREISYGTDRLLHVPDISVPLKNLATVAASAAMIHIVGVISADPRRHAWLRRCGYALLAAAGCGMTVLFLIVPRSPARGDFVAEQVGTPAVTGYGGLTQLGLTIGLISALVLFRPPARGAAPGALRAGLHLLRAGAVVGLLFMANRLAYLLSNVAGSTALDGPVAETVSRGLLAVALLLLATGGALPALGGTRRRLAHHRALRRLRPLWRDLCAAVPEVVLAAPPGRFREFFALRTVDLRLYRRIIEIRDAQRLLLGDRGAAGARPGVAGSPALRAAIESDPGSRPPAAIPPAGGTDIEEEIRALLAVARRYRALRRTSTADPRRATGRHPVATPVDTSGHNAPAGLTGEVNTGR